MNVLLISTRHGLALILFLLAALPACGTIPPGTGLNPAVPSSGSPSRKAWIGSVRILDPSVENRHFVEDALRASLADFVRETRNFSEVDSLPGNVQQDDVILDFRFDPYQQQRNTHPAYFPGAIVTMTLYTWLGGPIYEDVSNLSGVLTVKDRAGRNMTVVNAQVAEQQNVSLWSSRYALPTGVDARTFLMQQLLDKARGSLSGSLIGTSSALSSR